MTRLQSKLDYLEMRTKHFLIPAQVELRRFATKVRAKGNQHFFKTMPGQYGFGDQFIGVTVPQTRQVAKVFADLNQTQISHLLESKIHEDRLLALIILCNQFQKAKLKSERKKIVSFYLENRARVNNWDLVDTSSYKILGQYSLEVGDTKTIQKLAKSGHHWDRRIAIVSTLSFIRNQDLDLIFKLAEQLLIDPEDLMHKATGWMLREAGKKDLARLRKFIEVHGTKMPRTMLRYSIEKMSFAERKRILKATSNK